jgi:hypothetical protein
MNDEYRTVLPYLSCLENYAKVNDKDQYDLYKTFINFLKEKGFETDDDLDRLVSYIDILENSHQEISDVYVPDNFLETTVDETLLEEFVR